MNTAAVRTARALAQSAAERRAPEQRNVLILLNVTFRSAGEPDGEPVEAWETAANSTFSSPLSSISFAKLSTPLLSHLLSVTARKKIVRTPFERRFAGGAQSSLRDHDVGDLGLALVVERPSSRW